LYLKDYLVALLLADYDVDKHHILKPPERQNWIITEIQEMGLDKSECPRI